MRIIPLSAFCFAILSGCASVPMATHDEEARAKEFTPTEGMAGLYIYRNEYAGAAIKMQVTVDGKILGKTIAKSFLYTELAPGKHIITADAGNTDQIKISAEAGHNVFVHQVIKPGFSMAGSSMRVVDSEEGRQATLDCRMVSSQF